MAKTFKKEKVTQQVTLNEDDVRCNIYVADHAAPVPGEVRVVVPFSERVGSRSEEKHVDLGFADAECPLDTTEQSTFVAMLKRLREGALVKAGYSEE